MRVSSKSRKQQTPAPNIPGLSIVIPAYREEMRIRGTLEALGSYLKQEPYFKDIGIEVVVVAVSNEDRTLEVASQCRKDFSNFKVVSCKTKGKGFNVAYGIQQVAGKYVLFMDADCATPLWHIEEFHKAIRYDHSDIVIGTRSLTQHHKSFIRRGVAIMGNVLFRLTSGLWIRDSQCGFKIFRSDAAELCFSKLTVTGWGFDMEILTIASVNGLTIHQIDINDWKDVEGGTFNDDVFRVAIRSLHDLWQIYTKRLTGYYRKS